MQFCWCSPPSVPAHPLSSQPGPGRVNIRINTFEAVLIASCMTIWGSVSTHWFYVCHIVSGIGGSLCFHCCLPAVAINIRMHASLLHCFLFFYEVLPQCICKDTELAPVLEYCKTMAPVYLRLSATRGCVLNQPNGICQRNTLCTRSRWCELRSQVWMDGLPQICWVKWPEDTRSDMTHCSFFPPDFPFPWMMGIWKGEVERFKVCRHR